MYAILWPLFLDSKSLTLVVYNHSTYTSNRFFDSIGRWLRLAWFYMPETTVKITGTHSETMTTEQVEKTLSLVKADVSEYIERHRQNIQKEMADILSLISSSNQPKENLDKKLLYSRQEKLSYILQIPKVQSNPSAVSCDTCKDGVGNLVKELETLTVIRSSFPHIHQRVHSSWHLFRVAIKKRTDRLFLSWEEILEITEEFPPLDHDNDSLYECLRHLHNTGEILWYSSEEDVSQFIFHQPQMFANLLADLFRNDLSDWLTETNKVLACRGVRKQDTNLKLIPFSPMPYFTWGHTHTLSLSPLSLPLSLSLFPSLSSLSLPLSLSPLSPLSLLPLSLYLSLPLSLSLSLIR
ncbi:unnamed protein product [Acanthosepion pharaonis]|uniref:Uncharacterized protein n=1 Tax=Acanthosepion pharaonis TaxID=158019 RepID=A0A812BAK9_ACAPH|nr:unnamed protein product [Sepia pharaonis]